MANRPTIHSRISTKKVFRLGIVRLAQHLVDKDLAAPGHGEYPQAPPRTRASGSRFGARFVSVIDKNLTLRS